MGFLRKACYTLVALLPVLACTAPAAGAAEPRDSRIGIELMNDYSWLCLATSRSAGEQPVVVRGCGLDVDDLDILDQGGGDHQIDTFYPDNTKCIAARGYGEAPAVATGCSFDHRDQFWSVRHETGIDRYQFKNAHSGLCLAARGTEGTRAIQTTCDPGINQWPDQWWEILNFVSG